VCIDVQVSLGGDIEIHLTVSGDLIPACAQEKAAPYRGCTGRCRRGKARPQSASL